ncbi:MAG: hypothetical protein ACQESB_05075 [Elusimicrobiota bacterium]
MEFISNIEPSAVFAILVILFALLNLVLWTFIWKNFKAYGGGEKDVAGYDEKITRIEDQLWGVMDRIKELENTAENINRKIPASFSSSGAAGVNEQIEKLYILSKDTAELVQGIYRRVDELSEKSGLLNKNGDEFEKIETFLKRIDDNLEGFKKIEAENN